MTDHSPNKVSKRFKLLLVTFLGVLLIGAVGLIVQKSAESGHPLLPFQGAVVNGDDVVIYFSKNRGSEMVTEAVIRKAVPRGNDQAMAYAIGELLKGPNEEESTLGFFSEIPKGTRLLGVSRKDEAIRINLSNQFTSGGGSNSMQQRLKELTQTVQGVEKNKPVYVDIEGQQLEALGGEGVEVQEPINQTAETPQ